ncbi:MAG: porin family protein [Alphaproteobacteria bacterium]|jgi:opacity protein-like surface antigen|nr:porin family protein [Alphaproteobacteria bacterium]
MRQLLVWGSLVGVLTLAAPAGAGERSWYLGLEGGVEFDGIANEGGTGWAGLLTIGRGISSNVSFEAELGYRLTNESFWDADIEQTTLMLNAVFEAALSKEVSVAIGLGIGADNVSVEYPWGYSESEVELASQLKLGLSLAISESTEVVANYRYVETITDSGIDDSTLTVGVRFAL